MKMLRYDGSSSLVTTKMLSLDILIDNFRIRLDSAITEYSKSSLNQGERQTIVLFIISYWSKKERKNYFFLVRISLPFSRKLLLVLVFCIKNLLTMHIYVSTSDAIWLKGSSIFLSILDQVGKTSSSRQNLRWGI